MAEIIKGKTSTGFEYEINKEVVDDWNFIERLARLEQNQSVSETIDIIVTMIGREGYENLKKHCQKDSGRIPIKRLMNEYYEIMEKNDLAKN